MKLKERLNSPTPKFFRTLRTAGICIAAAAGVILTAPISVPTAVVNVAGYLLVAGGVISAVSQSVTEGEGTMTIPKTKTMKTRFRDN